MKTINYKNIEWIVLEEKEESKLLLSKNVLIKDVAFNENNSNDYENSNIRELLLNFIDNNLDKNDLIPFDNGDYGRLLTANEVIDLDNEILESDDWYWTMTPLKGSGSFVWFVNSYGSLFNFFASSTSSGVRPVIEILNSKLYVENNNEEEDNNVPIKEKMKIEVLEEDGALFIWDKSHKKCYLTEADTAIIEHINNLVDKVFIKYGDK